MLPQRLQFLAASLILLGMASLAGCRGHSAVAGKAATKNAASTAPFAQADIPDTSEGAQIRMGREIFNHTPQLASSYVGGKVSCNDCHIQSGTAAYAAPMVNLAGMFPMYNKRAGHMISLADRIQECFTRSENGHPLPYDSPQMKSLLAYVAWLSRDEVKGKPWKGRGFVKLPDLEGDPKRGAAVYTAQCAGCHGADGHGVPPVLPPVWGDDSYNDGAGMNDPKKMAAFVMHNMPQNHPGTLSAQDAFDVSAFVHTMPRPKFNQQYKHY